ncbi:hypothetical protein, partial [Azospirillum sp. A39]
RPQAAAAFPFIVQELPMGFAGFLAFIALAVLLGRKAWLLVTLAIAVFLAFAVPVQFFLIVAGSFAVTLLGAVVWAVLARRNGARARSGGDGDG